MLKKRKMVDDAIDKATYRPFSSLTRHNQGIEK
ncbi:hypothetical protein B23_3207 [Geobacillus thermoleovorans B23]|nr:hypothetical protein B23_3207 [Geobacillus thermoleovorans B23]